MLFAMINKCVWSQQRMSENNVGFFICRNPQACTDSIWTKWNMSTDSQILFSEVRLSTVKYLMSNKYTNHSFTKMSKITKLWSWNLQRKSKQSKLKILKRLKTTPPPPKNTQFLLSTITFENSCLCLFKAINLTVPMIFTTVNQISDL